MSTLERLKCAVYPKKTDVVVFDIQVRYLVGTEWKEAISPIQVNLSPSAFERLKRQIARGITAPAKVRDRGRDKTQPLLAESTDDATTIKPTTEPAAEPVTA